MKKQAEADAAAQGKAPGLFDGATTPDAGAQDTAEATALMQAQDEADKAAADAEDEFPDAFKDEEGNDRKAPF